MAAAVSHFCTGGSLRLCVGGPQITSLRGGIFDPRPASRHIRSVKEKRTLSSGVLRLFAWTAGDGESCVWGARAEAKMGQGARGKCVSVMGVTRRHGNECHQWRFTSSVVTPQCFWCTAVRIALKSPECFSIMVFVKHLGYSKVCLSDAATEDCSANISQSYFEILKDFKVFQKLLCTPVVSFTDTLSVCIVKKKKKKV